MVSTGRFTSRDLDLMPTNEGWRYEVIDGELYVSKMPHAFHQMVAFNAAAALEAWGRRTGAGRAFTAPGVIFSEDNDVGPDVAWVAAERLPTMMDQAGHFRDAPDLIVEVLSSGRRNEARDREEKLQLYSRRGVAEYWIVDWRARVVEVYRREGEGLLLVSRLGEGDAIESPLLAGFGCPVGELFVGVDLT